jgi:hypothetical protein
MKRKASEDPSLDLESGDENENENKQNKTQRCLLCNGSPPWRERRLLLLGYQDPGSVFSMLDLPLIERIHGFLKRAPKLSYCAKFEDGTPSCTDLPEHYPEAKVAGGPLCQDCVRNRPRCQMCLAWNCDVCIAFDDDGGDFGYYVTYGTFLLNLEKCEVCSRKVCLKTGGPCGYRCTECGLIRCVDCYPKEEYKECENCAENDMENPEYFPYPTLLCKQCRLKTPSNPPLCWSCRENN